MQWTLVLLSMVSMVLAVIDPSNTDNFVIYVMGCGTCQVPIVSHDAHNFILYLLKNDFAVEEDDKNEKEAAFNEFYLSRSGKVGACVEAKKNCKTYADSEYAP